MRYIYLILSLILSAVIFALGLGMIGDKDRSLALRYTPHEIARNKKQLNDISNFLRNYHKLKGRYPTNDEGLSVLAEHDSKTAMGGISNSSPISPIDALPETLPLFQVRKGFAQSI